jgi:anti-sigma regulatory factor (Ser/Thr protein kinase)
MMYYFIGEINRGVFNMIVELPSKFSRETMYHLLDKVIDNDLRPKDDFIGLSFETLNFIEPPGVTILSNLIEWLIKNDVKVGLFYPESERPYFSSHPLKYLDDSKFFLRYMRKYITNNPQTRRTTMPLELINMESSFQWLDSFTRWLSRELNVKTSSLTNIKMSFGEIFNNIRDHAFENVGCTFAQHYPNKNLISIVISDFGVGIPTNIRKIHPSLNDAEAIRKAIEEGITSRTSPRNLGVGLHTLYKNVVEDNHGSIHIHSNYGILDSYYGYNGPKIEYYTKNSFYPGTLIEVNLRTNNIFEQDDEEEFDW